MKLRLLGALALGVVILLTTPSASFADATSTPRPTPTPTPTPTSDFESAITKYEIAIDQFRAEIKAREQIRNKITRKFFIEVNEANRIAKTAMRNAKTVDTKSVALAQQKSSVVLAASARDTAIAAMGPAPLEPVEPLKPEEPLKLLKPLKQDELAPIKKTKPDKPRPTPKK